MAEFRGTDMIPGPTVSFKDPDGPDNKHDGVVPGGTNKSDVATSFAAPPRPCENDGFGGWILKPGME